MPQVSARPGVSRNSHAQSSQGRSPGICVVARGASRLEGGMFDSIRLLWQGVHSLGAYVCMRALHDAKTREDAPRFAPIPVETLRVPRWTGQAHVPGFLQSITRERKRLDLISIHGMWTPAQKAGWQAAQQLGLPYMIHPEGMLDEWALKRSRWKKQIVGHWWQNRALRAAPILRALCPPEAAAFRRLGLRNPVAVIPNGVHVNLFHELPDAGSFLAAHPRMKDRKIALFISRVHPKKGLPNLINAWKALGHHAADWHLAIVGPDEAGHMAEIKKLIDDLGLADSITLTGPLYGDDKLKVLGAASLFVLPSHSEGFPIALLEAAASGLPILQTPGCNFPELTRARGALEVPSTPKDLAKALSELMSLSEHERLAMGRRGRELVTAKYDWSEIASSMAGVCDWMISGGPRPPEVETMP